MSENAPENTLAPVVDAPAPVVETKAAPAVPTPPVVKAPEVEKPVVKSKVPDFVPPEPARNLEANDKIALLEARIAAQEAAVAAAEAKAAEVEVGRRELLRDKALSSAISKHNASEGIVKDALSGKAKFSEADGKWAITVDGKELSIEGAVEAYLTKYPQLVNKPKNMMNRVIQTQSGNKPVVDAYAAARRRRK